ncbi:MAG: hypothetical protein ABL907_08945 [Hyphomicrobium sp.]
MLFRIGFIARFVSSLALFGAIASPAMLTSNAEAGSASPFTSLAGRWVGEGRFGIKDNPPESVKCRATYIAGASADELKQTIRCATAGGSIEVISAIQHAAGVLTGSWSETTHNIAGSLEGQVTPTGFRIVVKGSDLAANMDVLVKSDSQLVEIQFFNSALIGLTLVLHKG